MTVLLDTAQFNDLCNVIGGCSIRYYCSCTVPHTIPLEAWLLKASPANIRKECVVCPYALRKLRTYEVSFRKRRLTNVYTTGSSLIYQTSCIIIRSIVLPCKIVLLRGIER